MIQNHIILGGYGQFVWPAFIFTFFVCFVLYLKTKKKFLKQEKMFLHKLKQTQAVKIKVIKEEQNAKRTLSNISTF